MTKTVELEAIRIRHLGLHSSSLDKRRIRRYHRKAAQWWLQQGENFSTVRLSRCHLRDARNG